MRGSLDGPPIIIRQSRFNLAIFTLFVGGLAVLFDALVLYGSHTKNFVDYATASLLNFFPLLFLYLVISPGRMTLDTDGLVLWSGIRHFRYAWSDFERFILMSINWPSSQAGFLLVESARKKKLLRRLSGGLGAFGGYWELGATDSVALLTQAKARWDH